MPIDYETRLAEYKALYSRFSEKKKNSFCGRIIAQELERAEESLKKGCTDIVSDALETIHICLDTLYGDLLRGILGTHL